MGPSPLAKTSEPGKASRMLYLDIARVVAIFLVCLNHAVNRSYDNYGNQMAEFMTTPMISTLFKTLCTVASRLGVPLFLMISGVLMFKKSLNSVDDIKRFYKHNLWGIFITTEIWYVIMYWFLALFVPGYEYILDAGLGSALWGMVKTMLFLDQVTMGSMWYMPMILCVYTTIPFLIIVKDKLKSEKPSAVVFLPVILLYLVSMVMPAVNAMLKMNGEARFAVELSESNLFSMFYLYILVGYFVGQGGLSKCKTWLVGVLAVGLFGFCCGVQYYAYSQPMQYLVDYTYPLLPICAAFLFELFRRIAPMLQKCGSTISYLSRICFGIYFVHIVIMTVLTIVMGDWDLSRPMRLITYQMVSYIGSIAVIFPLAKVPLLRKYLFMYK